MKKFLIILMIIGFPKLCCPDVYVSTTGSDSTGDGTISNPYRYIQTGIDALTSQGTGNTLYLRGGTYTTIPTDGTTRGFDCDDLSGSSWANSYTIRSYPGEWAVIDGSGYASETRFYCFDFDNNGVYGFVKFSHLEIKNCHGSTHCTAIQGSGGPYIFEYLYIHDNTCDTASNNPAGIIMWDGSGSVTIQYCNFYGNGYIGGSHENSAQVAFFSDYLTTWGSQSLQNANGHATARANCVVKYCFFDGANGTSVGVKHKNMQYLENNVLFEGTISDVNSWSENGNEIHHCIFQNHIYGSTYLATDFDQVYNNISTDYGFIIGYTNRDQRPPSDVVVYNNTTIDTARPGIYFTIQEDEPANDAYYERYWVFNNIIDNATEYDARQDIGFKNLYTTTSLSWDVDTLLSVKNNMFYEPQNTSLVKYLYSSFTLSTLNATMWGSGNISDDYDSGDLLFADTTGADQYKLNSSYSDYTVVSTGGYNQSHPYLSGVTIPAYIGAVNPSDNDWVDGVLALDAAYMTTAENDPAWIEGAASSTTRYYLDADGDGYSPGDYQDAESDPGETWYTEAELTSIVLVDCNDSDAAINPGATDISCDGIDQDCSGSDNCPGSISVSISGATISGATIH